MPDIFVSYAHRDADDAFELKRLLEYEGWEVWIDRPELNIGDELEPRIRAAISDVRCVVVLRSEASRVSQWVRVESGLAAEANKLVEAMADTVETNRSSASHALTRPFLESPARHALLDEVASVAGLTRPRDSWDATLSVSFRRAFFRRAPLIAKEFVPSQQEHHQLRIGFEFTDTPFRLARRVTLREAGTHKLQTTTGNVWALGFAGSKFALALVSIQEEHVTVSIPKQRRLLEQFEDSSALVPSRVFSEREKLVDRMEGFVDFRTKAGYTLFDLPRTG